MPKDFLKIPGRKINGEIYLSVYTLDIILLADLDILKTNEEVSNYIKSLRERIAEACNI